MHGTQIPAVQKSISPKFLIFSFLLSITSDQKLKGSLVVHEWEGARHGLKAVQPQTPAGTKTLQNINSQYATS